MGLQLHPLAGFDKNKATEILNIPEALVPITILAGGYPSEDHSHLNKMKKGLEQTKMNRLPQESFVVNKAFLIKYLTFILPIT
jgi:hypothetical protein